MKGECIKGLEDRASLTLLCAPSSQYNAVTVFGSGKYSSEMKQRLVDAASEAIVCRVQGAVTTITQSCNSKSMQPNRSRNLGASVAGCVYESSHSRDQEMDILCDLGLYSSSRS